MVFENDYIKHVENAGKYARIYKAELHPEEAVSTIYETLFTKPDYQYSFTTFDSALHSHYKFYYSNNQDFVPYTDRWKPSKQNVSFKSQNTCSGCKQTKNATEFRIVTTKGGKKIQAAKCHDCEKERSKSYHQKNKQLLNQKKREKYHNNLDAHKKRINKNNRINRQKISDNYLKGILCKKYSIEYLRSHPEIIEQARLGIVEKRKKDTAEKIKEYQYKKSVEGKPISKISPIAFNNYGSFVQTVNKQIDKINSKRVVA